MISVSRSFRGIAGPIPRPKGSERLERETERDRDRGRETDRQINRVETDKICEWERKKDRDTVIAFVFLILIHHTHKHILYQLQYCLALPGSLTTIFET